MPFLWVVYYGGMPLGGAEFERWAWNWGAVIFSVGWLLFSLVIVYSHLNIHVGRRLVFFTCIKTTQIIILNTSAILTLKKNLNNCKTLNINLPTFEYHFNKIQSKKIKSIKRSGVSIRYFSHRSYTYLFISHSPHILQTNYIRAFYSYFQTTILYLFHRWVCICFKLGKNMYWCMQYRGRHENIKTEKEQTHQEKQITMRRWH